MNKTMQHLPLKQRDICLRIIDANMNRVTEGLRVCEDITRFVLNDRSLQKRLKLLRHSSNDLRRSRSSYLQSISARNIKKDVGVKTLSTDMIRKDFCELFIANAQRVKESLRVLEEVLKLVDLKASEKFKKIRFDFYIIEKKGANKVSLLIKGRKVKNGHFRNCKRN